jgi:predicted branched-subunit amino acid permease
VPEAPRSTRVPACEAGQRLAAAKVLGDLSRFGFDAVMVAYFTAVIVGQWKGRWDLFPLIAAGCCGPTVRARSEPGLAGRFAVADLLPCFCRPVAM